jgi:hypothetical protein
LLVDTLKFVSLHRRSQSHLAAENLFSSRRVRSSKAIGDLADHRSLTKFSCHVPMQYKPLQVERFTRIPRRRSIGYLIAVPEELFEGYRTNNRPIRACQPQGKAQTASRMSQGRKSSSVVSHEQMLIEGRPTRCAAGQACARMKRSDGCEGLETGWDLRWD